MTRPGRTLPKAVAVGCVAAVALAGIVWSVRASRGPSMAGGPNPAMTESEMADIVRDMRIGPFTGVDHRGEPVDAAMLRGHWSVVSFGFTHCTVACPMMHGEIHRMAEKLADRGVRFVTFSVDPAHDTIDQMAAHVDQWNMRGDAWMFIRTDDATVRGLLAGLMMPTLSEDPANTIALPGGATMANIQHPTRFFVVGPDGSIKGLWRASDPREVDAMIRWLLDRAG